MHEMTDELFQGLIPAHAGKTWSHADAAAQAAAHPRSRGENHGGWFRSGFGPGSSPLTRGKPRRNRLGPQFRGLIPAHAGKTFAVTESDYRERAHPRSRGENYS